MRLPSVIHDLARDRFTTCETFFVSGQKSGTPGREGGGGDASASSRPRPATGVGIGEGGTATGLDDPSQHAAVFDQGTEADGCPRPEVTSVQLCRVLSRQERGLTGPTLRCTGYSEVGIERKYGLRRDRVVDCRKTSTAQRSECGQLCRKKRIDRRVVGSDPDAVEKKKKELPAQSPGAYSAGRRSTVTCT